MNGRYKNMKIVKDNRIYETGSRWIKVNYKIVTPRHSLYEYGDGSGLDEYGGNKDLREVITFRHNGKVYALNQFMRLSYPIMLENEDGITAVISVYDATQWYKPYLLEIHPDGEYIRLWIEKEMEV